MPRLLLLSRVAPLAVALGATGCASLLATGTATRIAGGGQPAPLEITMGTARAYAGTVVPLRVTLRTADSSVSVPADSVVWESSSPGRAWVMTDGLAQLYSTGTVTVTARYREIVATRRLHVRRNPTSTIVVERATAGPVVVGDTIALQAMARDDAGAPVPGAVVTFALASRGDSSVGAVISTDGHFTATRPGTYLVIASTGARATALPVRVELPTAESAPPMPVVLADSTPASRITALPEVRSVAPATTHIRISRARYQPYVGTTLSLDARVWTGDAEEPDSTAIPRWGSSDTTIATVDGFGTVVFLRRGWVTISARHGGQSATRRFNVLEAPAADLVVRSDADYVRVGDKVGIATWIWVRGGTRLQHARANYAILGGPTGAPVDAGADAQIAATISESGAFVARTPGVYTVLAQLGDRASTTTFVVHPAGGHCELQLRRWDPSCAE